MRPGQDERITHLFKRGYSLDLVSEFGCLYGWTRNEAKAVLADNGWSLDFSGRLQPHHMKETTPMANTAAHAGAERLLNAGIDHENVEIRKVALQAEKAIERLRAALMNREKRDAESAAAVSVPAALNALLGVQTPADRPSAS